MLFLNIINVLVLFGTALVAGYGIYLVHSDTERIMVDAATTAKLQLRAYVDITGGKCKEVNSVTPPDQMSLECEVFVKNFGKTPSNNICVRKIKTYIKNENDERSRDSHLPKPYPLRLAPGAFDNPRTLTADVKDIWDNYYSKGKATIYTEGIINYDDEYGRVCKINFKFRAISSDSNLLRMAPDGNTVRCSEDPGTPAYNALKISPESDCK